MQICQRLREHTLPPQKLKLYMQQCPSDRLWIGTAMNYELNLSKEKADCKWMELSVSIPTLANNQEVANCSSRLIVNWFNISWLSIPTMSQLVPIKCLLGNMMVHPYWLEPHHSKKRQYIFCSVAVHIIHDTPRKTCDNRKKMDTNHDIR